MEVANREHTLVTKHQLPAGSSSALVGGGEAASGASTYLTYLPLFALQIVGGWVPHPPLYS